MTTLVNLTDICSQTSQVVKFIFVKESDYDENFEMIIEKIKEHHPDDDRVDILESDDVFEMDGSEIIGKEFIFVFDKFNTPAFDHLSKFKGLYILGTSCVLKIFNENTEVPNSIFHIHNLCMKDLIVCFSAINNLERKSDLKKLIGYMGGSVSNSLTDGTTHLITEDVFSKKYNHAGSHKIKIMNPMWVDELWKLSQDINFVMKANDKKFIDKYQLKIFHKLVISSTGLEANEKKLIIKLIEDNGGVYSHVFKTSTVKVLILQPKDIGSVKYKASLKHKILCLNKNWIIDSIEAKYALNIEDYEIKNEENLKSSTPEKGKSQLAVFNFDNTMLSDINSTTLRSVVIDETQKSTKQINDRRSDMQPRSSRSKTSLKLTKTNLSEVTKDSTFKKPPLTTKPCKKTESFVIPSPPKFDYSDNSSDESLIQILIDKIVLLYGYTNDVDGLTTVNNCEKYGATIVDLSYKKTVDYVITPTGLHDIQLPKIKYKNIVSDTWLIDSVEEGRCIEPIKFYHNSIFKLPEKFHVLDGEVFVCSNYDREKLVPFIKSVIKALGGLFRDSLSRNEAPILICPSPEGKKYEGAKEWGLTVLKAEWLIQCYQKRQRYDETEYLVGTKPSKRNNLARRDSVIPCSQEYSLESPVRPKKSTYEVTPKTPNNLEFVEYENRIGDISHLLEDMPTPQRNFTKSALLDQQKKTRMSPRKKLLKDLMQTPGNAPKSTNEYASSPAPQLPSTLEPPPDGNYSVIRRDASPASQWHYKRKLEAVDARYVPVSESTRKILKEMPQTPPISHMRYDFFKKRLTDYTSPNPRIQIEDTQALFMARVTANMSNEASKFLNFEDTELDGEHARNSENQPMDSDIMRLHEILRQEKANRISEEPITVRKSLLPEKARPFRGETSSETMDEYYRPDSRYLVRWSNSQAPANAVHANEENEVEKDKSEEIEIIDSDSPKDYIFAISSGTNGEDKQHLIEKIERLGGKLAEQNFTHLIMTKLSKSSKFFSALAGGKFVLHIDYINDSLQQNKFLDVEKFEYGNPDMQCLVSNVKEPQLAQAPYKCRQAMNNNPEKYKNGLFTGLKFIVLASAQKIDQFVGVIESGGGTIINEKPEFKPSVLKRCKVDYCLAENIKMVSQNDKDILKACNVQLKNIKFINDYLLSDEFF